MFGGQFPQCAKKDGDQALGLPLENIDSEEVALSEVPEENEIVLVIFGHRVAVLVLQRSPSQKSFILHPKTEFSRLCLSPLTIESKVWRTIKCPEYTSDLRRQYQLVEA